MQCDFVLLAFSYIDICCFQFSKENFRNLLAKKVELFHVTNNKLTEIAQGRDKVVDLFNRFIFTNTTDLVLKEVSFVPIENRVMLRLSVEENKHEEDQTQRYHFDETTVLHMKKKPDKTAKITKIEITVQRIAF
jgi:hypothetical protein